MKRLIIVNVDGEEYFSYINIEHSALKDDVNGVFVMNINHSVSEDGIERVFYEY